MQLLHFPFRDLQIAAFRNPANEGLIRVDHREYDFAAIVGRAVRAEPAGDFA